MPGGDPVCTGAANEEAPNVEVEDALDALCAIWPEPDNDHFWCLPPEQDTLEESSFSLHRVAKELTVVMSTSIGLFTPSVEIPLAALKSLQDNLALRWCKKILVFDAVPSEKEISAMEQDKEFYNSVVKGRKWAELWESKREAYQVYQGQMHRLKEEGHPALFNVELCELDCFGHLFGTVERALKEITTPYVFMTQHDLRLNANFQAADVQRSLEALEAGTAKYILLNRDENNAARCRKYFNYLEHQNPEAAPPNLTPVHGFSDQAHFAVTEWYRREVVAAIPSEQSKTCMEHILHAAWKTLEEKDWKGTCLYGGLKDGPYVFDNIHGMQVSDTEGRKTAHIPPPPTRVVSA